MSEALSEPSVKLASQITRELRWEERIEGFIFDPGPGEMVIQLYTLQEVYRLLKGATNFVIDFAELQTWIRDRLGDFELAEKIRAVSEDDAEKRTKIVELLGNRLTSVRRCYRD